MEIERIAVRLRRRTPWEALDLGHAMLRAWAGPAYRAWFGTYWVSGSILLGVFWFRQDIALLVLWWLKPLFDRVLLFTFSRSLFNTPTAFRDVLRALPGLIKGTSLLSGLTLRRFGMARSFLLPVWQLEGQRGKTARARFQVLCRRIRGTAVWLTLVCANLGVVLSISLAMAIAALTPQGAGETFSLAQWFLTGLTPGQRLLAGLLIMVGETLVEPLYVASGFALYLHRRSELEGWDIELAFRRLAQRAASATPARTASGMAAAFLLVATLALAPEPSRAEAAPLPAAAAAAAGQPKETIARILADPVFGHKSEEMQWRLRQTSEKRPTAGSDWGRILLELMESLGQMMKGLVWIGALLLAVWLAYLVALYRDGRLGRESRPPPPDFLFGLDVRPESLPADIAAATRAALAAGEVEQALSLLYRGALVTLIHRQGVEFQPGDTENDCRHRVEGRLEPAAGSHFGQLLDAWLSAAYAHQPPSLPALEALCRDWESHFGPPAAAAVP